MYHFRPLYPIFITILFILRFSPSQSTYIDRDIPVLARPPNPVHVDKRYGIALSPGVEVFTGDIVTLTIEEQDPYEGSDGPPIFNVVAQGDTGELICLDPYASSAETFDRYAGEFSGFQQDEIYAESDATRTYPSSDTSTDVQWAPSLVHMFIINVLDGPLGLFSLAPVIAFPDSPKYVSAQPNSPRSGVALSLGPSSWEQQVPQTLAVNMFLPPSLPMYAYGSGFYPIFDDLLSGSDSSSSSKSDISTLQYSSSSDDDDNTIAWEQAYDDDNASKMFFRATSSHGFCACSLGKLRCPVIAQNENIVLTPSLANLGGNAIFSRFRISKIPFSVVRRLMDNYRSIISHSGADVFMLRSYSPYIERVDSLHFHGAEAQLSARRVYISLSRLTTRGTKLEQQSIMLMRNLVSDTLQLSYNIQFTLAAYVTLSDTATTLGFPIVAGFQYEPSDANKMVTFDASTATSVPALNQSDDEDDQRFQDLNAGRFTMDTFGNPPTRRKQQQQQQQQQQRQHQSTTPNSQHISMSIPYSKGLPPGLSFHHVKNHAEGVPTIQPYKVLTNLVQFETSNNPTQTSSSSSSPSYSPSASSFVPTGDKRQPTSPHSTLFETAGLNAPPQTHFTLASNDHPPTNPLDATYGNKNDEDINSTISSVCPSILIDYLLSHPNYTLPLIQRAVFCTPTPHSSSLIPSPLFSASQLSPLSGNSSLQTLTFGSQRATHLTSDTIMQLNCAWLLVHTTFQSSPTASRVFGHPSSFPACPHQVPSLEDSLPHSISSLSPSIQPVVRTTWLASTQQALNAFSLLSKALHISLLPCLLPSYRQELREDDFNSFVANGPMDTLQDLFDSQEGYNFISSVRENVIISSPSSPQQRDQRMTIPSTSLISQIFATLGTSSAPHSPPLLRSTHHIALQFQRLFAALDKGEREHHSRTDAPHQHPRNADETILSHLNRDDAAFVMGWSKIWQLERSRAQKQLLLSTFLDRDTNHKDAIISSIDCVISLNFDHLHTILVSDHHHKKLTSPLCAISTVDSVFTRVIAMELILIQSVWSSLERDTLTCHVDQQNPTMWNFNPQFVTMPFNVTDLTDSLTNISTPWINNSFMSQVQLIVDLSSANSHATATPTTFTPPHRSSLASYQHSQSRPQIASYDWRQDRKSQFQTLVATSQHHSTASSSSSLSAAETTAGGASPGSFPLPSSIHRPTVDPRIPKVAADASSLLTSPSMFPSSASSTSKPSPRGSKNGRDSPLSPTLLSQLASPGVLAQASMNARSSPSPLSEQSQFSPFSHATSPQQKSYPLEALTKHIDLSNRNTGDGIDNHASRPSGEDILALHPSTANQKPEWFLPRMVDPLLFPSSSSSSSSFRQSVHQRATFNTFHHNTSPLAHTTAVTTVKARTAADRHPVDEKNIPTTSESRFQRQFSGSNSVQLLPGLDLAAHAHDASSVKTYPHHHNVPKAQASFPVAPESSLQTPSSQLQSAQGTSLSSRAIWEFALFQHPDSQQHYQPQQNHQPWRFSNSPMPPTTLWGAGGFQSSAKIAFPTLSSSNFTESTAPPSQLHKHPQQQHQRFSSHKTMSSPSETSSNPFFDHSDDTDLPYDNNNHVIDPDSSNKKHDFPPSTHQGGPSHLGDKQQQVSGAGLASTLATQPRAFQTMQVIPGVLTGSIFQFQFYFAFGVDLLFGSVMEFAGECALISPPSSASIAQAIQHIGFTTMPFSLDLVRTEAFWSSQWVSDLHMASSPVDVLEIGNNVLGTFSAAPSKSHHRNSSRGRSINSTPLHWMRAAQTTTLDTLLRPPQSNQKSLSMFQQSSTSTFSTFQRSDPSLVLAPGRPGALSEAISAVIDPSNTVSPALVISRPDDGSDECEGPFFASSSAADRFTIQRASVDQNLYSLTNPLGLLHPIQELHHFAMSGTYTGTSTFLLEFVIERVS